MKLGVNFGVNLGVNLGVKTVEAGYTYRWSHAVGVYSGADAAYSKLGP